MYRKKPLDDELLNNEDIRASVGTWHQNRMHRTGSFKQQVIQLKIREIPADSFLESVYVALC